MSEDVKEARKSTDLFKYHSCVLHILATRDKANILTRGASIDPRHIYRKATPISVPACCHIHRALHNARTIRAIQATKRMSQCKSERSRRRLMRVDDAPKIWTRTDLSRRSVAAGH
jgi:hypothetical protein